MKEAQKAFKSGKKSVTELKALITEKIQAEPLAQIDYIDIYTFPDLEECEIVDEELDQQAILADELYKQTGILIANQKGGDG